MLSAPPRTQTNRTRRSLKEAKPARTLNNPLPPRFHPNLDDREIQLLLKHDQTAPPDGEAPTEWRLLTTLDVRTAKDAAEIVGYYLQRWRIEDFFRVLKSGCRTEFLLFRTADRLQRAVAVNAVIAWRIMAMTLLGRQVPDCGPEMMFTGH